MCMAFIASKSTQRRIHTDVRSILKEENTKIVQEYISHNIICISSKLVWFSND